MPGVARLPGGPPGPSHSELICLPVMQALLGFVGRLGQLRLVLVEALVKRWGARPLADGGKVVYAVLDAVRA